MEAGDVVRVALRQADGQYKPRPALLITQFPPYGDWFVCGISSSLHLAVPDLDVVIDAGHPDLAITRLGRPGVVRVGFANTIAERVIEGTIGSVSRDTLLLVRTRLAAFITA
ncbi:MAG: type II toxin-antitoxin system PemK/MazF family toxin [Flavobacteriales bacterium]